MSTANSGSGAITRLGIVSTLIDAALALKRGRKGSALLLVVAAAVSSRLPGFGVAVSVLLRAYRRLR